MLIDEISRQSGISSTFITTLARTASHRYKKYQIPKKQGGMRTIFHPSRQLKFLQRWLVTNVLSGIAVHSSATAYIPGSSILKNASVHVRNNFLLRLDFRDFFPSIRSKDIERHLEDNISNLPDGISSEDINFITMVATRDGGIVIGAPSSPILANQIMLQFDERIANICAQNRVFYTRYADDMYFSTNERNVLFSIHCEVVDILDTISYPRLEQNSTKVFHTSRKRKRLVTGLSLTSDKKVSLGRTKKRTIRTQLYLHSRGELSPIQSGYLYGYLCYAESVEPAFVDALRRKFGSQLVEQAMKPAELTKKIQLA